MKFTKTIQKFYNYSGIKRFREIVDAVLIIGTVFIVGVIALYFNVFRIELTEFFGGKQSITQVEVQQLYSEAKQFEMTENLEEFLLGNQKLVAHSLHDYDLRTYLHEAVSAYNLPLTVVPPGRMLMIDSQKIQAPIVEVPYASAEKLEKAEFKNELKQGVVAYPGTSKPNEPGPMLLFGHSSVASYQAAANQYGFVFYKLPKVEAGERVKVIRDGKIYAYEIKGKEIVAPGDVGKVIDGYDKSKHSLALMACYPVLSTAKRIVVQAELVSDDVTVYSYLGRPRQRSVTKSSNAVYAYDN